MIDNTAASHDASFNADSVQQPHQIDIDTTKPSPPPHTNGTQPHQLSPTQQHTQHHTHDDDTMSMTSDHVTTTCTDIFTRRRKRPRRQKTIPTEWQKASQGGRPQFHLANERTYLAWMRTGFTSIALGIAVAKFGGETPNSTAATVVGAPTTRSIVSGSLLVALGGLTVIYGTVRYKRINTQIEKGYFIIGSRGREPIIFTVVTVIVVTIAMALLFTNVTC